MPDVHVIKNNFSSGETTPFLEGRASDAAAVQAGCRVLENFIVRPYGGICRRPGTQFVENGEIENGVPTLYRLIPFRVSQDENYVLEFGKNYIRIWDTGITPATLAYNEFSVPFYQSGVGYNQSELVRLAFPSGYAPTLSALDYNVVAQCQRSYTADDSNTNSNNLIKALSANDTTTWRLLNKDVTTTVTQNVSAPFVRIPAFEMFSDGPGMGGDYNSVLELSFAWQENSIDYVSGPYYFWPNPTPTNTYWQVLSSRPNTYTVGNLYDALTGVKSIVDSLSAPSALGTNLSSTGINSALYIYSGTPSYEAPILNNDNEYNAGAVTVVANLTAYRFFGEWEVNDTRQFNTKFNGYNVVNTVYTPYDNEQDVKNLQYVQLNDVMFLASENHPPKRLSRLSNSAWVLDDVPFEFAPVLDVNETTTQVQIQYDVPDWSAPAWETATDYLSGDRVYDSTTPFRFYTCKLDHTSSASTEPNDGASWTTYWNLDSYAVGDRVVNDAGILYTCYTAHTAVNTASSNFGQPGITTGSFATYWNEGTSAQLINTWAAKRVYAVGDVVKWNRVLYRCIQRHKSINPAAVNAFDGEVTYLNNAGNRPGYGKLWSRYWKVIGSEYDVSTVRYKLASTETLFTPADVNTKMQLKIGIPNYYIDQKLNTISNDSEFGPSSQIFIQGEYLVTTKWNSGSALVGNIILEESLDGVVWTTVKEWVLTNAQENNIAYTGEAPATGAWYRFRGYKKSGGQRSIKMERIDSYATVPFEITEYISSTEVRGFVNLPNNQLPPSQIIGVSTKLFSRPAFSSTQGYPRAVAFYENRLWWAGTEQQKGRLWASATDDFYNYLVGVSDTDALDLTLAATETNEINWIKPFNKALVVATAGEVWTIDSGEQEGVFTPTSARAKLRLRTGASRAEPQITGESLLWVQNSERAVREFAYRFEADQFTAPDMTLFSSHIARDGIKYTAFQMNPEPIWWGISNGALLGMTYNREQQVVAWHKHITGLRERFYNNSPDNDNFICVTVVGGSYGIDQVWFITERRAIGTDNVRKIERFHPGTYEDMFTNNYNSNPGIVHVDCARLSSNSSTVSGNSLIIYPANNETYFENLKNVQFSSVQGTGLRYRNANLTTQLGNKITFEQGTSSTPGASAVALTIDAQVPAASGSAFWVGVPYTSICIPNRIDIPLQNGTSLARKMRANRIQLNLVNSIGGGYQILNGELANPGINDILTFEKQPSYNDAYDVIDYSQFVYNNHSMPERRGSAPASQLKLYTGSTQDQHINTEHMNDLTYAIVVKQPVPFNLLSIVQKIEVEGN